jgi:tetratricopeptide (TPR) repeat protein
MLPLLYLAVLGATAPAVPIATKPILPDDMRPLAQEAADFFAKQRYEAAAVDYEVILRTYPDCLYAWANLGVTRFQQGHFDDARKAFGKAVSLNPTDDFSVLNLAITDFQLGLYEPAIKNLKAAIALKPNNASAHSFLASALDKAGHHEEAQKELELANKLKGNDGSIEKSGPQL